MRELLLPFLRLSLRCMPGLLFSIKKRSANQLGLAIANSYTGPIQQSIQRVKIAPAQEPLQ